MQSRQPARWGRNLLLLIAAVALGLTAWFWTRMRTDAVARTAYAAQTACLCRFAAGRPLASCQADPAIKQDWVGLHEDTAARTLTASVPLLAEQTSRWSRDAGCVQDVWKD
ncbi:hypothetical protein HNO88_001058 [Novosphingobium chloroacetimidivorans]|uniref:Uncharacterized protein n=1 Tax=Novosphingobium chloroacetimidivorans TaxID=1428314 RepID=A0A7W7K7M0_9SPHN|nr:hypothetical protein [Novosphingobium chloroacetimidivorans]MBB4857747.1 hypothetical protein [Novosphingobium chloroacetimidivorans]